MRRAASIAVTLSLVLVGCAERPAPKPAELLPTAGAAGTQPPAAGSGGAPMPDAQVIPDAGPPPIADAMPVHSEDDAGSDWVPPEPVCRDGAWRLAPGFLLARRVDYVADRETRFVDGVALPITTIWSEAGIACASAMQRENCLAGLALPGGVDGRHLITTAGDRVQLWPTDVAMKLLGIIDTPAEAIWWLATQSTYLVPCDARVEAKSAGYLVHGALSTVCGDTPNATHRPIDVLVEPSGTLSELGPTRPGDSVCAFGP